MWIAEAPLKPAPDRLHQDRGFGDAAPAASVSSGIAMPSQPASAIARWNSCGKPPNVGQLYTLFGQAIHDCESRGASAPMWIEPLVTGLKTKRVIRGPACGASAKFRRAGCGRSRNFSSKRQICQCETLLLRKPNHHRVANAAAHRKNFMHMVGVTGKGQQKPPARLDH
jgi:hypothetical protein